MTPTERALLLEALLALSGAYERHAQAMAERRGA